MPPPRSFTCQSLERANLGSIMPTGSRKGNNLSFAAYLALQNAVFVAKKVVGKGLVDSNSGVDGQGRSGVNATQIKNSRQSNHREHGIQIDFRLTLEIIRSSN